MPAAVGAEEASVVEASMVVVVVVLVADTSEAEMWRAEVASEQLEVVSVAHVSQSLPDTSLTFGLGTASLPLGCANLELAHVVLREPTAAASRLNRHAPGQRLIVGPIAE
jgi:hypothetical protein